MFNQKKKKEVKLAATKAIEWLEERIKQVDKGLIWIDSVEVEPGNFIMVDDLEMIRECVLFIKKAWFISSMREYMDMIPDFYFDLKTPVFRDLREALF